VTGAHWDHIYRTKTAEAMSWYAPHLDVSLAMIDRLALAPGAAILDAGGGASTLVDDLLARGFTNLTVLDLSQAALETSRARLGAAAERVLWVAGDITEIELEPEHYELWHDRAVFHFLTDPATRAAYARQMMRALRPGGHAIVSTFGPEGPTRCSGLEVVRYDVPALGAELSATAASGLRLLQSIITQHATPRGGAEQFVTCLFRRD